MGLQEAYGVRDHALGKFLTIIYDFPLVLLTYDYSNLKI